MDPETWRWIWLGAAVALAIGELAVPGTFFLVSFAVGAGAAALVAFLDGGRVRVERDEWRAETDSDDPIPLGTEVEVLAVRGTRLVVTPAHASR
jgi:membrane protein implicated in regulation of membrane protease activity